MGSDTIPARSNGSTIQDSWWNLLRDVLAGDFYPRDSSGVVTDQAGSLGSSTLRWFTAYLIYLRIMNGSYYVSLQAPSDLATNLEFTLPTGYAALLQAAVLMSSSGVMSSGTIDNAMLEDSGEQVSSSSGSFSSSSTGTWIDVTNLSVVLPVVKSTNSIVQVGLVADGGGSSSHILVSSDTSFRILRDATEIWRFRQANNIQQSIGGMSHYDIGVSSGSYTYKMQVLINSGSVSISNVKLMARELI